MPASFNIYKYIGKDGIFGNPVSSIGLKRVDQVVPAVYGNPVMPGDDISDVNTYSVYRSENGELAYSYESIFKLVLSNPPANQCSNVRIYPSAPLACDPATGGIYIGTGVCFSRPTNTESLVATTPLYEYTKDNPFYIPVNRNYGQHVDPRVTSQQYQLTAHDVGYGNVFFVNGDMQMPLLIVLDNTYTLVNNNLNLLSVIIYDVNGDPVIDPNITTALVGDKQIVTINATSSLMNAYPGGLVYGDVDNPNAGSTISWKTVEWGTSETIVHDVVVDTDPTGRVVYYVDGKRQPTMLFQQKNIYEIHNHNGATYPLRLVTDPTAMSACANCGVALQGITVYDGGTDDEVIVVNTDQMYMAGPHNWAWGYQAVNAQNMGGKVYLRNTCLVGNYNINTVGAGVANPMKAGETDFIYLQMRVTNMTSPTIITPDIIIEWDEN